MSDLLIASEMTEQGAVEIYRIKPYRSAVVAESMSVIGRAIDTMTVLAPRSISEIRQNKIRARAICAEAWEVEITKLFSESYEVDNRTKHNNYLAFWGI